MHNALDDLLKDEYRKRQESLAELAEQMQRNPLEQFSTTQLKAELRRRKKAGKK